MTADALTAAYTRAAQEERARRSPGPVALQTLSASITLPRHLWPAAHDQVLQHKVRIETLRLKEDTHTLFLRTTETGAVLLCAIDSGITRCDQPLIHDPLADPFSPCLMEGES